MDKETKLEIEAYKGQHMEEAKSLLKTMNKEPA